ncbi:MAG: MerR family transcriptional regulator [Rhizobium rhizophilum]|uniref:MerR family transcriptional regulator n=1 Tax=Rhizobium rhizophilum TaxID=1850373 RepID=UPI0039191634
MVRIRQRNEGALINLADALSTSGLTKLLLHAWERRYGLTPAERTDTGRRFYTADQVERMRLLKSCSDGGHRIGSLVELPTEALTRIEQELKAKESLTEILKAMQALDSDRLHALLQARADTEDPELFIRMTVLPLMREVGTRWASGRATIAAEHLATAKIKRILGGLFDRCPPAASDALRLVATTPEREEHDIGALVVTLLARLRGWNALFLGASLPADEIADAAHRRGARCVCLSALNGRRAALARHLRDLRSELAPGIDIWIGGPAYEPVPSVEGATYLPDLDAFLQALDAAQTGPAITP